MTTYITDKSPADEFSLKNHAVVRDKTHDYAKITAPGLERECYLTLKSHNRMESGKLGLSGLQVHT